MNIKRCNLKIRVNNSIIQEIHNLISMKKAIKRYNEMGVLEFAECGIKLKAYQKTFLKLIDKKKNIQLIMPRQYRRYKQIKCMN